MMEFVSLQEKERVQRVLSLPGEATAGRRAPVHQEEGPKPTPAGTQTYSPHNREISNQFQLPDGRDDSVSAA